nr:ribonuclease H-like domain-containing protein [Tanacetum cinerariifolium]
MFQWRLLLLMHWFHSVMVLEAMIGAFRQMKNQQTKPSWHSPPQVLIMRKSEFNVLSYKTGLKSVEARLVVYQQNEHVFEEDIKVLKLDVMLRDNALVELRKKFEKAEQERDELKLKLDKFQTFSKNLCKLLASQITDKTGIGYDNQVFNSTVFDSDELISSESDVSMPPSPVHDRYQSGEGYHAVSPPYIGIFMPPKPELVFHDAPTANEHVPTVFNKMNLRPVEHPLTAETLRKDISKSRGHRHSWNRKACFICKSLTHLIKDCDYYEKKMVPKPIRNHAQRGNHQPYARMTPPHTYRHVVPTTVLTRSRLVPLTAARPVTTVVPQTNMTRPRTAKTVVNAVEGLKGKWGNPKHALKDKGVIDSGCSRYMTGNISYLSDFEAINGGYVAFGGNPKGGKITKKMCDKKNSVLFTYTECIVLSSDFKLPDENHVLLRVPRENNMYNVDLKNIVPSGDLTCLFAKDTLDESNLWHRRIGHINFKTMNKLVKGKFNGKADEGFLVGYSVSSKAFRVFNSRTRIVQETLHVNFLENQPNVAGSGPTWLFDIDTLTQSMNYQPVLVGNQPNSSACIQEHFDAGTTGERNVQQYVLFPLWSTGSKDPQNTNADTVRNKKITTCKLLDKVERLVLLIYNSLGTLQVLV